MNREPSKGEPPQKGVAIKKRKPTIGPVSNLEEYVKPDWWKNIFNSIYLKTDADVVNDRDITRNEIDLFIKILSLSKEDRVLDLCCGHGRHSIELANRGFTNIEGLDRSRYLIQKARKLNPNIKFREGDARKLGYPPDSFDAVMILGNSFGYFETTKEDLVILKQVFKVLRPGGRFLIDVTDGEYIKENYQPRSWEWIDSKYFVCRERMLSSDNKRLITREIVSDTFKGIIADQFYAESLYSFEDIKTLLEEAGFSHIEDHGMISPLSKRNQDLGMMERKILVSAVVEKQWAVRKGVKKKVKNIVVVMGDPNKADILKPLYVFDDDDFYTINMMKSALSEVEKRNNCSFTYLSNHDTLINDLLKFKGKKDIDLVLNLCDEGYLNEARKELHIPALLEMLGLPYTGSHPQCLAYCYDKSLVRGISKEMGIPVPEAFFIKPEDNIFDISFDFPVIVKPNFGDSSFGITRQSVAYTMEKTISAISNIRNRFGYDKPILIEEFLTGSDLSIGIIGNSPDSYVILPIIEEDYSSLPGGLPKICGYEAKWLTESPYWNIKSIPASLDEETERFMGECSLKLFERLECRDYCRFDWRLDSRGTPKLLEVNPNPGWCWDGHLAKMSAIKGISYSEMLQMIINAAENRINNQ